MNEVAPEVRRTVVVNAARNAIKAAQTERALLPQHAPERHFYLGVEAAALELLHPELASSRADGWLDRERPEFRDGYLRMSLNIATTVTREAAPTHFVLPEPRPSTSAN